MRPCVLFVDDEPFVLDGLRVAMHDQGWEILTATDPREALGLLTRHEVDAVVSDDRMPGMSGSAFLAEANRVSPRSACLMLTGHADHETLMRTMNQCRILEMISKPVASADLARSIRSAIVASGSGEWKRWLGEAGRR